MTKRKRRRKAQLTATGAHILTTGQRRYLAAVIEMSAAGKMLTQKDLAEIAKVSESQVSRWQSDCDFVDAVALSLRHGLRASPWLRAELAAAARATKGSLIDWRLYLEYGGPTSWRVAGVEGTQAGPGQQTPGADVGGYHVHIHGIPERRPMSELPPPLNAPGRPAKAGEGTNGGR